MSLNSRIKDVYASLTTSEKIIADYFLMHREEVETSAVKDLAEKCGVIFHIMMKCNFIVIVFTIQVSEISYTRNHIFSK